MKQVIALLSVFIFSLIGVLAQDKSVPFIENVDAQTFKLLVDKEQGIILDVRTPGEVATGHIPNASVINFYDADFEAKINLIQKNKEIYVYCKSGGRSSEAAKLLQKNGFNRVYNLQGGVTAWSANQYPLTQPTGQVDTAIQTMTQKEFDQFLSSSRVVLVDFHTPWCSPCRKMVPVVDQLEKEYEGKVAIKRVDVDKSKEIAKTYSISGVPVFILFVDGKITWTHNGIISKELLQQQLEQAIQK